MTQRGLLHRLPHLVLLLAASSITAAEPAPIDATTLDGKVLCGYQGWFRCPGDPAGEGWLHWSRNGDRITPRSLTIEMWPDLTDFTQQELYPAPGFTNADGEQAYLFSSAHPQTVARHFDWMQQYGLDGVVLQRFLVNLDDPSFDLVLSHVRDAATRTGRAYAIGYDLTGAAPDRILSRLSADWRRLVDELKITEDDRYLHHDGRPVLMVWGFFSDRFDAAIANQVIDFLQADGPYRVVLIGGCHWDWRRESHAEWEQVFRRFDVLSPWNVGNYEIVDGQKQAATGGWLEDVQAADAAGMEFMPVLYPGFGWTNLRGEDAAHQTIPRLKGDFFWRQFAAAAESKVRMAYVAMFDEVDEATAIFKVTNRPPAQARFQTYEGLPSDWYLRLTGEGARMLRGERSLQTTIPIEP
jgi:hypothetical protein